MIYRFTECELDTQLFELRHSGKVVPVQPQVFNLLLYLIEHRDQVVTKDELLNHVWPGRVVSESTLSSAIKAVRKAIGDSGQEQKLVKTLHGRGFHFVGQVTSAQSQSSGDVAGKQTKSRDMETSYPSIAVLPFLNMSDDPDQEHFADGITEDIISLLSRYRLLHVASRNSTFSFKGLSPDVGTVAQELGVRYILEGSIRRSKDTLRVSVQFIEVETGRSVWSENFSRHVKDIFDVQDDIARAVAGATISELTHAERERAQRIPPQSLDAWECYQRGLIQFYRFENDGFIEAKRLFERAIELDDKLTLAHTALAYTLLQQVMYTEPDDPQRLVETALLSAREGVALDDRNAFGHYVLGRIQILMRELETACLEFEKAIDLNPSFAYSYFGLGIALLDMSDYERSLTNFRTARELSPRDPHAWAFMHYQAWALIALERYREAIEVERVALRSPNAGFWPYLPLIAALGYLNRKDEAAREIKRLNQIRPGYTCALARRHMSVSVNPIIDLIVEGLTRAGLPD